MLGVWGAFPDYRVAVEDLVTAHDRVAVRMVLHGTHLGSFGGVPATGTRVSFDAMAFFRLENGEIVEEWFISDQFALQRQLGVSLSPTATHKD